MKPKVVITIEDKDNGDLAITGKFIPGLKKNQRLTKAQSFALDLMGVIGGETGEAVSRAIKRNRP